MSGGWATLWNAKIMTEKALKEGEVVDFSDHHSATLGMRPGTINPYKLGVELWRSIEERWDRGQFGREYDQCDDLGAKRVWDNRHGVCREESFEGREVHNEI